MIINRHNTIVKMVIFFGINVFLVNIDWILDNMVFTSIFRPLLCILGIWLLVEDKNKLKGCINKIRGKDNIPIILAMVILIIPFRIVAGENVVPVFWKSDIIATISYYMSNFMIAAYEEINFRYIFIKIVDEKLEDEKLSGIFATVTFALMHVTTYDGIIFNIGNLLGALILGLGLYYIARRYGLLQSSIVHFFYNVFLVMFLDYDLVINVVILVSYNFVFIISVILLLRIIEKNLNFNIN